MAEAEAAAAAKGWTDVELKIVIQMSKFFIFDHAESEKWQDLAKTKDGFLEILICCIVCKNLLEN